MKCIYLFLIVLITACQTNQKNLDNIIYLPDLDKIGTKCDSLRSAGSFDEAARLYFKTGQQLKSSELFVYAGWQYGEAKMLDSALIAINRSIDFGMSNPNILAVYELDKYDKKSLLGKRITQRLDSIKQIQSRVENFELVLEPLDSFWKYFDKAIVDTTNAKHYLKQYILNGSNATKDYYHKRYENVNNMFNQMIVKTPNHYEHTRQFLTKFKIDSLKETMNKMIVQFSELYPSAVYPKAYIVPGILSGNGTQTEVGLFTAAEMFVKSDEMSNKNLYKWQLNTIRKSSLMIFVTIHEWMHFQQSYHDKKNEGTLLHKVIEEGVCDFLVELLSDINTLDIDRVNKIEYLNNKENLKFIISEFKRDIYSNDLSKWMYNGGTIKDRPSDMGYAFGYKICKSYYERSKNKKSAIWELLNTDDFKKILAGSEFNNLLE